MNSTRLAFADGLRGGAALWVVLFHMAEGNHLPHLKNIFPSWLWKVFFELGHLGVPVFFVLSGFVMAWTARGMLFDAETAGKFLLRRLLRLSPPYYFAILIALSFMLLKQYALGGEMVDFDSWDVLSHLVYAQLLIQSPVINAVFWTLCMEIQFYVIFALMMYLSDKPGVVAFRPAMICLAASVALLWPLGIIHSVFWNGGFLGFWYAFLAGMLSCLCFGRQKLIKTYLISYCAVLLIAGLAASNAFVVSVAITSFLLMVAGATGKLDKWLSWRWLQFLGLVSYSLYLLHNPLTGASFRVINRWLPSGIIAELIAALATLAVCIVASGLAYRFVEKPSIKLSHLVRINQRA